METASDVIDRLSAALRGRYRIEREVGAGGMATVYLADDLKHGRQVAVKVLKAEVAAVVGEARFLAEIGTTAKLQHPHILPLFDSGAVDDLLFYVTPFVEGGSLEDRLHRERQLPVDEAVRITVAAAQALDYAHRHGVVHRDIKPANILMHDGQPMIADFGIALAVSTVSSDRLTATGMSLGTPLYMSPEQATGERIVGAATDIYALGCVLYELLVGEPPYTGSTPQAILARIITGGPVTASVHRRSVPVQIDTAIQKALEQVPADRFASAGDFAAALSGPNSMTAAMPAANRSPRPWKRVSMALAATTALLVLTNVWSLFSSTRRSETKAVARFDVTPADSQRMAPIGGNVAAAISPDGSWIVYVGRSAGGSTQLWRRQLSDLNATPLPGTEGATAPVFSPNGESIAFYANGDIRTISLAGGAPKTVVSNGASPAWGPDGTIYFARDTLSYKVPAAGGTPVIAAKSLNNVKPRQLDVLPNGGGFLFTAFIGTTAQAQIAVAQISDGSVRTLFPGAMARYSPTGHIVYTTANGTLMAVPFDAKRLEVTGAAVTIAEGVSVDRFATAQFALSPSGMLLYGTGAGSVSELVWVNRAGKVEPVDSTWSGEIGSPVISPDGKRVAVAIQGQKSMDIWVKQLDRGPSTRVTVDGGRNDYPTWTPDGASVTFSSDRISPSFDLWTKRADGSSDPVLEIDEKYALAETLWSPDGQWLIYRTSSNVTGAGDIVGRRGAKGTQRIPLVASAFTETAPAISPDGHWLAYSSNETGSTEVFVVPFPNTSEARYPVSVGGGAEPVWSRDGRELFYRNAKGSMMAVRVETTPSFSLREAAALFPDSTYFRNLVHRQYDVAPDGRFLMVRPLRAHEERLVLVQNFFEELKRSARK